ncbi:aspartate/glutamate racemase family protein [Fodinicurvata sediminis]|uniref:aspartate/glutamate racemase family protein n=1 Tax=Fodinicurvata sediminis TaxID=1121832 RepID=UPI0003B5D8BC|nr:amino acid racemase [Fodinicurvata sediminis]
MTTAPSQSGPGKTLGLLGGMGPEATVELMRRVVAATPARDDADHIRMLVDNNPQVPSRIAHVIEGTGEDPTPVLVSMAEGLKQAGADFLAMPCNTAHWYLPAVCKAVDLPFLDMIDLSVRYLQNSRPPLQRVALLASPAVRKVGLFDQRLQAAGFTPLHAEGKEAEELLKVIRAVKAKGYGETERRGYQAATDGLRQRGAQAYLIACTELSVIDLPDTDGLPIADTLDLLVAEILKTAGVDSLNV